MTEQAPPSPPEETAAPSPEATENLATPPEVAPEVALPSKTEAPAVVPPPAYRPNYVFLGVVSVVSLVLDLGSKWWAKARLDDVYRPHHIEVIKDHLAFTFARNRGGAFGLLQDQPENIRRPFFLGISVLAIVFIVSLYRKLTPQQWALKWGLPLVLGGALGNLVNRIQYNFVVDFIDVRASAVRWFNSLLHGKDAGDHWPTFNVADIAIVAGVALMAIDMFTPRKAAPTAAKAEAPPPSGMGAASGPGPQAPSEP
jgi:signal peptidase II